jgi:hypothetical protein
MNFTYLAVFVGLYLASCIPMVLAGHIRDVGIKVTLLVVDFFLTVAAYVFLWYSMPSTFYSLLAIGGMMLMGYCVGELRKAHDYHPYGRIK